MLSVETWCLTDSVSIQTKTSYVFPEPFDIYVHSIQQWQALGRLRVVPLFCFVCRARREKATARKTSGRAPLTLGISRGHFILAVFFRSSLDRVSKRGSPCSLNYVCPGHKISSACAKRPQGNPRGAQRHQYLKQKHVMKIRLPSFLTISEAVFYMSLSNSGGGGGTPRNYG